MSAAAAHRAMLVASRVQLVPPASWAEDELVDKARALAPTLKPVRPGDEVGGLVVLRVEPEPGATLGAMTELEVLPAPRRPDAATVDVAVLLDASESMGTPWDAKLTRLQAVRAAVQPFLASAAPGVASVAVFEYAKECRRVAGPGALGDVALGEAPKPKGPSDTARAIDTVLAEFAERAARDRSQVILLLTDGVGDVDALRAAAARAGRLRVPVHTLVFAPEIDEAFDAVATASGGSVQQASHPLAIEFVHQPGENA